MKKHVLILLLLALGGASAWAQTSTTDPTTTGTTTTTPTTNSGGGQLRAKLQAMTPQQRQEFLENHPRLREKIRNAEEAKYNSLTPAQQQQFAQNHPQFAQHLQNEAGAGTGKNDPNHPRVNEVNGREGLQAGRINQGVSSGQLTPGEDNRLQRGESRIQNQEANDMAKNGGHLTKAEQLRLNHEQNRESRRIYRDKHNDRTE